jgi:type I restriction enzyme S subunit
MDNWEEVVASKFCESVRDGTHDSPKSVEKGRYLITSRHLIGGSIDLSKAYFISQTDFDEVNRRSKVDQWDVLFTMIGTVGEVCLVKERPNFAIKNIGLFKPKSELDGKWIYYYFLLPKTKQIIESLKRGTTQSYIPLGELRLFSIVIPSTKFEMAKIVDVLCALDDKIENNRRMNETLEEMARVIFKRWFVDFDPVHAKAEGKQPAHMDAETAALFPSSINDDGLPEGWVEGSLSDTVNLIGGGTPKTKEPTYWGGDIDWFSVVDAPPTSDVWVIETKKRSQKKDWQIPQQSYSPKKNNHHLSEGDGRKNSPNNERDFYEPILLLSVWR